MQINEYQYGVSQKVNKKQGNLVLRTYPVLVTSVSIYAVNTSLSHVQCVQAKMQAIVTLLIWQNC